MIVHIDEVCIGLGESYGSINTLGVGLQYIECDKIKKERFV